MTKFPSIAMIIPELKIGDEQAWNSLCDRFRAGLISKTRQLINASNLSRKVGPEDIVQETFLKAWNQRATFRGQTTSQFAKWILTILRNTFLDWCRKAPGELTVPTWYGFDADEESPSGAMISVELEAELHACMSELDARQQEVLTLRHFEGLKFVEMSERLNQNINTVAGTYRRSLARLTELLHQRGVNLQQH